jgi:hypothetical protein
MVDNILQKYSNTKVCQKPKELEDLAKDLAKDLNKLV